MRDNAPAGRRAQAPPTFTPSTFDGVHPLACSNAGGRPNLEPVNVGGASARRPADVPISRDRPDPHSRALRLHRLKDRPATFFVTKSLWPKKPLLTPELRAVVCSAFRFAVEPERIVLRPFVVMPDHWHGLFALFPGWTVARFVHSFMSFVGGKTATTLRNQGTDWEEAYYDTRIRSSQQFLYVASYIAHNPVKKGLVSKPKEWDATHLRFPELITEAWPWEFELDGVT